MKPLIDLCRPCIWRLEPYSSARDEYSGHQATVFLDANENPYNHPLNRYPDPMQTEVKAVLAQRKGVAPENIFLGNGSDEAIDLAYRCFAEPGVDNVVAIEPTYGMYKVCADINNVEYRPVLLDDHFRLDADKLLAATDEHTKIVWLCSPTTPTGNDLAEHQIWQVLQRFQGLVVVDEAYVDFSSRRSFRYRLGEFHNLIVLQTFSKAWGSAAIRLGMAFASADVIRIFNKVKYPYNVNALTQREALRLMGDALKPACWVAELLDERQRLMERLTELPLCLQVYPTDANFFLARVTDAQRIYDLLVAQGIIVRNRTRVRLCAGCLRITIGTPDENDRLIAALKEMKL
ncbi:MAG: histidinol-phosphate transaminase [Prevotella sp.]|nr:histidinol-phosphate transaminase [Prevotella sp.]